jgi:signal transduction histidine kinase
MSARDYPSIAGVWDPQPMRREQDHIAVIETRIRNVLFGENVSDASASMLPFTEALHAAITQLSLGMHETLVEVWLVDSPPWGKDHGKDALRPYASSAGRSLHAGLRTGHPPDDIILAVLTAGRPLRLDDAVDHPLVRAWASKANIDPETFAVFLGVPIRFRGNALGVLAVGMAEPPSVEHVRFVDNVAAYIAVAAEDAHSQYMLHSQRELAQTVLREAPIAAAVFKPDDYTIVLTNPLFDRLLNIGPDVWEQRLDAVIPEQAPQFRASLHLDEVARTGESRTILDLSIRLATGLTYWDFTCSPIRSAGGEVSGILVAGVEVTARVAQRQRQKFNVDVAQERVAQMVALHQISLEVAAQIGQDPHELLRQIVERMASLVGAPGGMVYYADRETGNLEVVVSVGLHKDYTGKRLQRGEGLAGRVAVYGQGQMVEDYRQYPLRATVFADEPFGAMIAVPMKQRGQVIGVISLLHEIPETPPPPSTSRRDESRRATFTTEDIRLLELFAAQAAQAIENVRTYLDLERAYQAQRALDRQKDDFIARVSHDLRLPLTSVVGCLDLALTLVDPAVSPEMQSLLQQASDESDRLAEMLEQLLAQARLDSGKRELRLTSIRLASVVSDVVRARQKQVALHGMTHAFSMEIPEDLMVQADVARLKEVLENLISNAVKYSPHGGMVRVTAGIADDDPQMVLIRVSDEGVGIPPEAHEHIFERFTRSESALASEIRGTGLGLYLARQLIESMGGAIWLERSEPGKGSTFAYTLPLASAVPSEHLASPPNV